MLRRYRRPAATDNTNPTAASMPPATDMRQLYISSYDAFHGRSIDQIIPQGWNDKPPLFLLEDRDTNDEFQLLKGMIRRGIPEALRCAIWISNVVKACHPHQPESFADEYRTLNKVRALDYAWDTVLQQVEDDDDVVPPAFGADLDLLISLDPHPVTPKGMKALSRVLQALEHVVGLDYAPLLPTMAFLSLHYMSESYVFGMLRDMSSHSSFFLPTSPLEHYAWCRAFADVLQRLHPQTAAAMQENGSLVDRNGLDPIFKYFFLPILPFRHVLRIMDIYTLEGYKVLFRFGVALLCLFKKDLKAQTDITTTAQQWWSALKDYTHHPKFPMELLIKKAYGYHGSRQRKRIRFPRRHILARIIHLEQERASQQEGLFLEENAKAMSSPPRPLGLVDNVGGGGGGVLAKSATLRAHMASWLPLSLRLTKLDLIYSTNLHGRTLERFYAHVGEYKHTFLLAQVLETNATIGMFASQAWHVSARVYGDGECFLFRAHPDPVCYKWKPPPPSSAASYEEEIEEEVELGDQNDEECNHEQQEQHDDADDKQRRQHKAALLQQFMVGRETFISMGGNPDGSSGLRLNEDLTKGESAPAEGFHNEPLAPNVGRVFEVGLVEVYRLVRQVDGKSIDVS